MKRPPAAAAFPGLRCADAVIAAAGGPSELDMFSARRASRAGAR